MTKRSNYFIVCALKLTAVVSRQSAKSDGIAQPTGIAGNRTTGNRTEPGGRGAH